MVIGRVCPVTPDQARRIAHKMLGKVADGQDPANNRARARNMPTLCEAFQDYMSSKSYRSAKTGNAYRRAILEAGPECEHDDGRTAQPDAGHPDAAAAR